MDTQTKPFAFKLAEKKEAIKASDNKWKAREGVSVAGCSAHGVFPGCVTYGDGLVYC